MQQFQTMTKFLLIRHGTNDLVGKAIAGRQEGVHLNDRGRAEANALLDALSSEGITQIVSSPLDRCRETAAPIAKKLNLQVQIDPSFVELGFGDFTGKTLDNLRSMEEWKTWNTFRSGNRIPNGELSIEMQARVVTGLDRLRRLYPGQTIAIFSHGDPIRSAFCYYLNIPLDFITRFEVSPGSISALTIADWGPHVLFINACPYSSK